MFFALHPGHDTRRRPARGRRGHRRPGRRGGARPSSGGRRRGPQARRSTSRQPRPARAPELPVEIRRAGVQALLAQTLDRGPAAARDHGQPFQRHADPPRPGRCGARWREAEVGDEQRFDSTVNKCRSAWRRCSARRRRCCCRRRGCCRSDRLQTARPARRRRSDPRPHLSPGAVRSRSAGGIVRSDAPRSRRRRRHLHRSAEMEAACGVRRPLRASLRRI